MKRRRPRTLWYGLLVILAAPVLYFFVFVRYPVTRDVPWPALLMFGAGLGLVLHAMRHAYGEADRYRGKVAAPIVLVAGIAISALFSYGILVGTRDLPASGNAPRVGDRAPDFTLPDQDGRQVTLAQLLAPGGAVLVFYRGTW